MMEYDSGDPVGCLDKALEVADWSGFAKRKAESASRGKLRGIGLCTYVEACGLAPSRIATRLGVRGGLFESATVRVHPTGHVTVLIGIAQSRTRARDDVRADRVRSTRHPRRQRRDRVRRYRQGAVRSRHVRIALGRGRRLRAREGGPESHRQGQEDRRAHARSQRHRHRVQERRVQRRRHRSQARPSATSR